MRRDGLIPEPRHIQDSTRVLVQAHVHLNFSAQCRRKWCAKSWSRHGKGRYKRNNVVFSALYSVIGMWVLCVRFMEYWLMLLSKYPPDKDNVRDVYAKTTGARRQPDLLCLTLVRPDQICTKQLQWLFEALFGRTERTWQSDVQLWLHSASNIHLSRQVSTRRRMYHTIASILWSVVVPSLRCPFIVGRRWSRWCEGRSLTHPFTLAMWKAAVIVGMCMIYSVGRGICALDASTRF